MAAYPSTGIRAAWAAFTTEAKADSTVLSPPMTKASTPWAARAQAAS